ncbi:MAG TPA: hypothetical protein VH143_30570 [Kofleriaceae bacterium]|nr:hypothetical protein [Kofleriaceae bacterium]
MQLALMNMQTAMMQTLTTANSNASNNAQLVQTMLSLMSGNGAAPSQYAMPYGGMPYGYAAPPMGYPYAAYGQPPMQAPVMPV